MKLNTNNLWIDHTSNEQINYKLKCNIMTTIDRTIKNYRTQTFPLNLFITLHSENKKNRDLDSRLVIFLKKQFISYMFTLFPEFYIHPNLFPSLDFLAFSILWHSKVWQKQNKKQKSKQSRINFFFLLWFFSISPKRNE